MNFNNDITTYQIYEKDGDKVGFWYSQNNDLIIIDINDDESGVEINALTFLRIARLLQNDRDRAKRFPMSYPEEGGRL